MNSSKTSVFILFAAIFGFSTAFDPGTLQKQILVGGMADTDGAIAAVSRVNSNPVTGQSQEDGFAEHEENYPAGQVGYWMV